LLARHKMTESIKPYIKAFCEGLWACISLDSLRIFSPEQLGLLISGRQEVSVKDMHACTKYEGFSGEEDCIKWFWAIVKDMDQPTVAKLLAFMTGMNRKPCCNLSVRYSRTSRRAFCTVCVVCRVVCGTSGWFQGSENAPDDNKSWGGALTIVAHLCKSAGLV
jgi:hypothetical protein